MHQPAAGIRLAGRAAGAWPMDEIVYTLIDTEGDALRARADDGHLALLVPDPVEPGQIGPLASPHPVLAALEGGADIDGAHWLAYRWAEGECLANRLDQQAMQRSEAVRVLLRLLDGIAHGRLVGLSFGPLVAERVLMLDDGMPLLAALLPAGVPSENVVVSAGQLLYRMLTGHPPLADAHGQIPLPSARVGDIDSRLENIVLGAMDEPGAPHYEHVLDLRGALTDYLDDVEELGDLTADDGGPVDQLLRRMSKSDDFPALSRAVSAINRIADADTERLQGLAAVILRDFSLTNKVLRLANSASYGQFGGATSTISRAVMVLGFNTIKALAMSVVLIEHLNNHEHAEALKDEVVRAFFASLVARKLAERCGYHDLEEARVAGMFHQLGRLLAVFYHRDATQAALAAIGAGERPEQATARHLGMTFEELGMGVARAWHLPDKLIASMAAEAPKPRPPRSEGDWLRLFANAGATLMYATLGDNEPDRYKHFLQARDHFAEAMRLTERDLRMATDDAVREALREASIFGLDTSQGGALARLRQLAGLPELTSAPKSVTDAAGIQPAPAPPATAPTLSAEALEKPPSTADRPEVVNALAQCVQEVSETLVSDFKLNDLLRVILETLFRTLEADRVLLATRSVQRNALVGRFGFGEDIAAFANGFLVPLDDSTDVFRMALTSHADLLIDDADAATVRHRIPGWFRAARGGRCFLLMPIVVERKVVGLLYADTAQPDRLHLGEREFSLAKTLRNQAILAIRQKSPSL
jgi:HD-like signal output (HDOD) protein